MLIFWLDNCPRLKRRMGIGNSQCSIRGKRVLWLQLILKFRKKKKKKSRKANVVKLLTTAESRRMVDRRSCITHNFSINLKYFQNKRMILVYASLSHTYTQSKIYYPASKDFQSFIFCFVLKRFYIFVIN